MQKVLITGAAGRIGRTLSAGLNGRCELRLMDRETIYDPEVDDVHVGDVADVEWMAAVCQGGCRRAFSGRSEYGSLVGIHPRSEYQRHVRRL